MNPRTNADRDALYGRVSGDRQEKQATIETQIHYLRERSAAEGRTIHGEYLDNPYTGTVDSRPALDRMRDDARRGLFNRVLIYDPDRLARGKPWLRPYLEEQLMRAGAPVVYLKYEVEDSPEGRVMDGMRTLFAEWEREKFIARTRDGKLNKVKNGHIWRGRTAFGYTYIKPEPGAKHGSLALVPEEAQIVRTAFDHILDGRSLRWVAAELVRLGVPTRRGGAWTNTRVHTMVTNPIYCGQATYNR
jgi:site-specific DNA recombinase